MRVLILLDICWSPPIYENYQQYVPSLVSGGIDLESCYSPGRLDDVRQYLNLVTRLYTMVPSTNISGE